MKKILSIHPWLLSFPIDQQVAMAKEAGFDGIDYIATMTELFLQRDGIGKYSKKYNMPVLGVHSPLPLVALTPSVLFSKLLAYISFRMLRTAPEPAQPWFWDHIKQRE